jgi:hypothetical protein
MGYNYPISQPLTPIYQTVANSNISFGNSIISQMNIDVAAMGIYQANQTINWLTYMQTLFMLLQNGFLLDAINEYTTLINDTSVQKIALGTFVNNTTLVSYQTLVQNWVNL